MIRLEVDRELAQRGAESGSLEDVDRIVIVGRDVVARVGFELVLPVANARSWLAGLGRQTSRNFLETMRTDLYVGSLSISSLDRVADARPLSLLRGKL